MSNLTHTRFYDFLMAVPLILWFGYGAVTLRPQLAWDGMAILRGGADLLIALQFLALSAAAAFNLLLVALLLLRDLPVRKSAGLMPRLTGFAGTFLGVGILHLPVTRLDLFWQALADFLIFAGGAGSVVVLARLGRGFSIMPEARRLVTGGLYALARHPLYAVEALTLIGTAIPFRQPWAGLIVLAVLALLWLRSHYEEEVLAAAFPEYESYRARVKRFGII